MFNKDKKNKNVMYRPTMPDASVFSGETKKGGFRRLKDRLKNVECQQVKK